MTPPGSLYRRVGKAVARLTYEAAKVVGHTDFQRFVIVSRSRTGSNLLVSLLDSNPRIRCGGEVFQKVAGTDQARTLGRIYDKQPRYIHAAGFKVFYYHPLDADGTWLWSRLEERRDVAVIHLKRRNILRTLISRKLASQLNAWTSEEAVPVGAEGKSVRFTAAELLEGFEETRRWELEADQRFRHHRRIAVLYEDLNRAPDEELRRITNFLGIPPAPARTHLRRQNPESAHEVVENFEELRRAFAGSPWAEFFEDAT